MKFKYEPLAAMLMAAWSAGVYSQQVNDAPVKTLGVVTVTGGQPTSLPTQIPTTMEGITREQIENTINATDSEDARYSGPQFRTLNNSDVNGFTYQGVSKFFVVDLRARYKIDKQWSAAFGIDNVNNYQYWNFHPYPQRSYSAELRYDL